MSGNPSEPSGCGVRGNAATDVTATVDTFIAEVPIDERRCILVYLREHGGRRFVRWRVFHRHQTHGNWYPDKRRAFVLPVEIADLMAQTIAAAPSGEPTTPKPAWLVAVDAWRDRRFRVLAELGAPPVVLDKERRRNSRGWCLGPSQRRPE